MPPILALLQGLCDPVYWPYVGAAALSVLLVAFLDDILIPSPHEISVLLVSLVCGVVCVILPLLYVKDGVEWLWDILESIVAEWWCKEDMQVATEVGENWGTGETDPSPNLSVLATQHVTGVMTEFTPATPPTPDMASRDMKANPARKLAGLPSPRDTTSALIPKSVPGPPMLGPSTASSSQALRRMSRPLRRNPHLIPALPPTPHHSSGLLGPSPAPKRFGPGALHDDTVTYNGLSRKPAKPGRPAATRLSMFSSHAEEMEESFGGIGSEWKKGTGLLVDLDVDESEKKERKKLEKGKGRA
ncbi:hypothetical protein K505DRAFT_90448 [Melanomma pulvis-pyrius CBS 109.77]|uniref:Uncharacterized protein n=1 Tax=Melanomma pulvis-pyrius CBS 109.77 TaxID=1314802 RepID=A0A6A6X1D1_9PLEO|nr:hypothetical protein K505DRAFT_90448 [Melanomma pulvis-pyrius CBS 109.77]